LAWTCGFTTIAHQFIFALRHQRLVRGLGIRHHQQCIAVGRRFGGLDRADHAAGAGPVLDHEGLAETVLQDVADQAGRDIGRATGAKGNNDPDRPGRIILREASGGEKGGSRQNGCRQREGKAWPRHFNLPDFDLGLC
jgi:hypothetical protein